MHMGAASLCGATIASKGDCSVSKSCSRLSGFAASASGYCSIFLLAALLSGPLMQIPGARAENSLPSGPLDGMVFAGKFGGSENPEIDDQLHFKNGEFWSSFCTAYGLKPGGYWIRSVGSGIEFRGVLTGAPGEFVYRGSVHQGIATVSIQWTKKRWYWTIEKNLEFVGKLVSEMDNSLEHTAAQTPVEPSE